MDKSQAYQLFLNRIIQNFSPTDAELHMIKKRLNEFDDHQLDNLEKNFTTLGIDTVIDFLYCENFRK